VLSDVCPALLLLGNLSPREDRWFVTSQGSAPLGSGAPLQREGRKHFMEASVKSRPYQLESFACSIPQGMDGTGYHLFYLHREQLWEEKQVLLALFRAVVFRPS